MIVIPIGWLILSLPAILAGWGLFAAAVGLLPLLTGAYVAVTGRPSWLGLWSRQTGALLVAASLVLVVGGTVVNRAVHPVLVVDTGMLGFAAPAIPRGHLGRTARRRVGCAPADRITAWRRPISRLPSRHPPPTSVRRR